MVDVVISNEGKSDHIMQKVNLILQFCKIPQKILWAVYISPLPAAYQLIMHDRRITFGLCKFLD